MACYNNIDLKDTIAYPHIFFSKSSGLRPVIDDLFKKIGEVPDILYEVEEDGALAGLVAEGFGIAVLPNISVLQTLDVKILEIINPVYTRKIYLAKVKNKYLAPIVMQFAKYVIEQSKDIKSL